MALFRWWTGQNGNKKKNASSMVKDKKTGNGSRISGAASDRVATVRRDGDDGRIDSSVVVYDKLSGSQFYELCIRYPVYAFESVRLLLFRENEYRERRMLFDSRCYSGRRCSEGNTVISSHSEIIDLRHRRSGIPDPSCDDRLQKEQLDNDTIKLLGEMIFGSVSMSVKVDTFKLHQFKSPQTLMLSTIFPCIQPDIPKGAAVMSSVLSNARDGSELFDSDSDSPSSTVNSVDCCNFKNSCTSISLEIPDKLYRSPKICSPNMRGHSSAPFSYRSEAHISGNGSLSSSLKRYNLNQSTNFNSRIGRRLEEGGESPSPNASRLGRLQLGFCVLFNVDNHDDHVTNEWFKRFLLLHMQIVEIELNRLQRAILRAYFSKKIFTANVWKAWKAFIAAIRLLYETPRLAHPVWLMQMQPFGENHRLTLHRTFLEIFSQVADQCDVRESKFFFSTLLTACLMNHLTWVSSVAAPVDPTYALAGKGRLPQWRKNIEGAAYPYNQHLAQLLDIWGVVTSPCRIAHTLILGENADLVKRILFVLSYFMRCSALERTDKESPGWPSLSSVLQSARNFAVAVDSNKSDKELRKSSTANGAVRCKSLLTGSNAPDERYRHCSEKDQRFSETTASSDGRIRCRSGSSLSTDRMLRMTAASFKLPSKLTTDNGSRSSHSPKLSSVPVTPHGAKLNFFQEQQLPLVTGLCQPLTVDVAQKDNGWRRPTTLPLEMCKSNSYGQFANSDNDSQAASGKISFADVFANSCLENLVRQKPDTDVRNLTASNGSGRFDCYAQNLGSAMIAYYSKNICPYFSLAGAPPTPNIYDVVRNMMQQLIAANIQSPEPIKDAVCVVANTDDWSVRVISGYSVSDNTTCLVPSKMVSDMVDQVKCLFQMKMVNELCLMTLEDRLSEMYSKSCALATLVDENRSNTLDMIKMVRLLGCDLSDIPLLISVATVHSSDTVVSLNVT